MTERVDPSSTSQMVTEIIVAYLGQRAVEPEQLPALVSQVRRALLSPDEAAADEASRAGVVAVDMEGAEEPAARPTPAVPIEESVTPDYLVSLEDGRHYRSLRRHLMAKHGMTPEQYRTKWGLPVDYPMVAPSYAADRSSIAKRIGLGRNGAEPPTSAPKRRKKAAAKS